MITDFELLVGHKTNKGWGDANVGGAGETINDPFPQFVKDWFSSLFSSFGLTEGQKKPMFIIEFNGVQYIIEGDSEIGKKIEELGGGKFDPKKNTYTININDLNDLLGQFKNADFDNFRNSGKTLEWLKFISEKSGEIQNYHDLLENNKNGYLRRIDKDSLIKYDRNFNIYYYKGKSTKGKFKRMNNLQEKEYKDNG